jgi:hypothetical protein
MITATDLNALWAGRRGTEYNYRILAIRGALELQGQPNRESVYDDVVIHYDTATGEIECCIASLDPAWPLIVNPENPDGALMLPDGGVYLFKKGIHKGIAAHPCLVQAESFLVWRLDTQGNVKVDGSGNPIHYGPDDFGDHYHSGGAGPILRTGIGGMPLASTCNFSAGCQIVHEPDGYFQAGWQAHIARVYARMDRNGQSVVPYAVIDNAKNPTGIDFTQLTYSNPVVA